MITDEEVEKYRKKAVECALAITRNLQDAEELAQDVLEDWLERGRTGATTKQSVIDAIRRRFGRSTRNEFHRMKSRFLRGLMNEEIADMASPPATDPRPALEIGPEIEELFGKLPPTERVYLVLYYVLGYTAREVGMIAGVTESRIIQAIGETKRKIWKTER